MISSVVTARSSVEAGQTAQLRLAVSPSTGGTLWLEQLRCRNTGCSAISFCMSFGGEPSQLLSDIQQAETLLLQRCARKFGNSKSGFAGDEAAKQLITGLRLRSRQLESNFPPSDASRETPNSTALDNAVESSKAAVQSAFGKQLLAELCSILLNLYCQQAQLQVRDPTAASAALTPPAQSQTAATDQILAQTDPSTDKHGEQQCLEQHASASLSCAILLPPSSLESAHHQSDTSSALVQTQCSGNARYCDMAIQTQEEPQHEVASLRHVLQSLAVLALL